jgi:hypothetical protein
MRFALVALLLLTGCSTTEWMPSDVDRNETMSALGSAGYSKVCSAFEGYIRDQYSSSHLIQAVCLAHGVQTTETAVACGDAVQACTTTLPPAAESTLNSILAQARCSTASINPVGCAATVAQLEDCLDALEDKLDALKFGLTCAAVGQTVEADWWRISLPAACQSIKQLCPQ